jgi:hypothetical protein
LKNPSQKKVGSGAVAQAIRAPASRREALSSNPKAAKERKLVLCLSVHLINKHLLPMVIIVIVNTKPGGAILEEQNFPALQSLLQLATCLGQIT